MLYRLKSEERGDPILNPASLAKLIDRVLRREGTLERDKEHFWVFGLDTRHMVKYCDLVSLGTLNYNLVHPREVFRRAIRDGVAAILVAHNHPSGCLEPSDEDLSLTKRLSQAGKLLGIELIDHVILGYDQGGAIATMSFKVKGVL